MPMPGVSGKERREEEAVRREARGRGDGPAFRLVWSSEEESALRLGQLQLGSAYRVGPEGEFLRRGCHPVLREESRQVELLVQVAAFICLGGRSETRRFGLRAAEADCGRLRQLLVESPSFFCTRLARMSAVGIQISKDYAYVLAVAASTGFLAAWQGNREQPLHVDDVAWPDLLTLGSRWPRSQGWYVFRSL